MWATFALKNRNTDFVRAKVEVLREKTINKGILGQEELLTGYVSSGPMQQLRKMYSASWYWLTRMWVKRDYIESERERERELHHV